MFLTICIIACVLFSISSVMASDANETIIANDDGQQTMQETNEETITANTEDELIATDNGTFTALQSKINNAAEGSTITLENDYAYDDGFDTKGIGISKQITIDGNGYTIDGKEVSRIFYITQRFVVLKNINFKNAYATDSDGGAIYLDYGNLELENCSFYNCEARYNGGAIFSEYGGNDLKNCNFNKCRADGDGGAIKGESSTYTSCTFKNCHAYSYGGAIESYSSTSTLTKCSFDNCNANMYGGAVRFCNAIECSFTNNYAGYGGGAMCYGEAYKCTFSGNSNPETYDTEIYSYSPLDSTNTNSSSSSSNSTTTSKTTKTTPKLTAKAATFKVKTKTKKYSVVLKTNKNKAMKYVKLYLKVYKKTYAAKTNKYGKATFKITQLKKKGTFPAKITYKGNSKYNKVTKTIKIKCK